MLKTVVVLVAAVAVVMIVLRLRQPSIGEVAPAGELREARGMSAEDYPRVDIDPANVPEHLRDLIPFAEEWGIGDDVFRGDYGENASQEQRERFRAALTGRTAQVVAWLDSFGSEPMSEEAGTFMYMLEALDEMGLWPD